MSLEKPEVGDVFQWAVGRYIVYRIPSASHGSDSMDLFLTTSGSSAAYCSIEPRSSSRKYCGKATPEEVEAVKKATGIDVSVAGWATFARRR